MGKGNFLINNLAEQNNEPALKNLLDQIHKDGQYKKEDVLEAISHAGTLAIKLCLLNHLITTGHFDSPELLNFEAITTEEKTQLSRQLFRFALQNKNFTVAELLLTFDKKVLAQINDNKSLLQEFFHADARYNDVLLFLIAHGVTISNAFITLVAGQRQNPPLALLKAITEHQPNLQASLLPHLFRHALLDDDLTQAAHFLETVSNKDQRRDLLNQVNAQGIPLLHECFNANQNNCVQFLIEQNCDINKKDSRGNTLVILVTRRNESLWPLLNTISEYDGDWSSVLAHHPHYLFTVLNVADDYPNILASTLKSSTDLLIKNSQNYTIITNAIAQRNYKALEIILSHIRELIVQKQEVANYPTSFPAQQMQQCSFVLEHCINAYKDAGDNNEVKKVYKDTGLNLLFDDPEEIYTSALGLDPVENVSEILFYEGLLDFLSTYTGKKMRPLPDRAVPFLSTILSRQFNSEKFPSAYREAIYATADFKTLPISKAYQASSQDNYYIKDRNRRLIIEQQEEERRLEDLRRRQIEAQIRADNQARVQAENMRQALKDQEDELPLLFAELLEILTDVVTITNKRDDRKKWLNFIDTLASFIAFTTTVVYSILCLVNVDDEVKDGYPNAKNVGISLAVYYAEFIFNGIFNGFFATSKDDWNDRELKFYHLPITLQQKITDIITKLTPMGLAVELDPNCNVKLLIELIFDKLKASEKRLINIQQQLPDQNLAIQNVTRPELKDIQWSAHKNIKNTACCYLIAVVMQGVSSGLAAWFLSNINGKATGYAYLGTLLSFPGYMIGVSVEKSSRYLTVKAKNAITPALNHYLAQNHAGANIEMLSLTAAHDDIDRMEHGGPSDFGMHV
jgi:hypothetical protein